MVPPLHERLIVALDVPTAAEARRMVEVLGDTVAFYKIGLQLFTAAGPDLVRGLVSAGRKVFLDLKYHDIPNTAAGAVRSAGELGVAMLTVHAAGGHKMMQAAAEAALASPGRPRILAVTVLTSMDEHTMRQTGVGGDLEDQVSRLALLAREAGCDGVVASPAEAAGLRRVLGVGPLLITPGIRLEGGEQHDQSRIALPEQAIRDGADFLVCGRPITSAADPKAVAEDILDRIKSALP